MTNVRTKKYVLALLAAFLTCNAAHAAEVSLQQLNWLNTPDGDILASRIFAAELSFQDNDPANMQLLHQNGGGYVNISVILIDGTGDWAVRNMYLAYPNVEHMTSSSPTIQFGLPIQNGIPIKQAFLLWSVTPEPLVEPIPQHKSAVPVPLEDYLTGGRVGGGTYLSDIPFTLGPAIGSQPASVPVKTVWTRTEIGLVAAIDENIDGCAPGSCARSITYLGSLHGFDTEDPQEIFAQLKEQMNTGRPGGTADDDMLAGKERYTAEHDLPINSHLTYGDDSLGEAMDAVAAGCDVEILIGWSGGGGHAAMVTSITQHDDGSFTITYVDDPKQNNGVAENEEHTIHVMPNGNFDGGHVDGFLIECVKSDDSSGDLNGDGNVNVADLLLLLAAWGPNPGSPGDLNGDGNVNVADLLLLLGNWGPVNADPLSCSNSCGGYTGACWCDEKCCDFGDCCSDQEEVCAVCVAGDE